MLQSPYDYVSKFATFSMVPHCRDTSSVRGMCTCRWGIDLLLTLGDVRVSFRWLYANLDGRPDVDLETPDRLCWLDADLETRARFVLRTHDDFDRHFACGNIGVVVSAVCGRLVHRERCDVLLYSLR